MKFHSKILQTVYSDSFSKNYYYTTLYVGDKKVKQIDMKGALEYARRARAEGREVTMEEMEQFVELEEE